MKSKYEIAGTITTLLWQVGLVQRYLADIAKFEAQVRESGLAPEHHSEWARLGRRLALVGSQANGIGLQIQSQAKELGQQS